MSSVKRAGLSQAWVPPGVASHNSASKCRRYCPGKLYADSLTPPFAPRTGQKVASARNRSPLPPSLYTRYSRWRRYSPG